MFTFTLRIARKIKSAFAPRKQILSRSERRLCPKVIFHGFLQAARAHRAEDSRPSASILSAAIMLSLAWAPCINSRASAEDEAPTDGRAAEQKIMAAMEQPAEFIFSKATLASVADHLEAAYQIPVEIDRKTISEFRLAEQMNLSLTIEGVKLRTALHFLLTPNDLAWTISNDSLVITFDDRLSNKTSTTLRVYDIHDLLAGQPDQEECDDWADQLLHLLHPDQWDKYGGIGEIRVLPPGVLVVSQLPSIQAEVRTLLSALRSAMANQRLTDAKRRYAPVHHGDAALSAAWRKRLSAKRDFALGDTPLEVLTAYLGDIFEAPVLIDNQALQAPRESAPAHISYWRNGVRTAAALAQMLGTQRDWYIKDEVLVITSRDVAERATEIRIYPVGDLISLDTGGLTPEVLVDTMQRMIGPRDWEDVGGAGVAEFFERGSLLGISQTFQNHERIEKFLNDLRSHHAMFEDLAPAEPPTRR